MKTTHTEYVAILRAGIDAKRLRDENTFAAACYNDNSVDELLSALRARRADAADCAAWNMRPSEWRDGIRAALAGRAFDYEVDNSLNADGAKLRDMTFREFNAGAFRVDRK